MSGAAVDIAVMSSMSSYAAHNVRKNGKTSQAWTSAEVVADTAAEEAAEGVQSVDVFSRLHDMRQQGRPLHSCSPNEIDALLSGPQYSSCVSVLQNDLVKSIRKDQHRVVPDELTKTYTRKKLVLAVRALAVDRGADRCS